MINPITQYKKTEKFILKFTDLVLKYNVFREMKSYVLEIQLLECLETEFNDDLSVRTETGIKIITIKFWNYFKLKQNSNNNEIIIKKKTT